MNTACASRELVAADVNLHLGCCIQYMRSMPEKSIDLTVTSPPYDNLRSYNGTLRWDWWTFQQVARELYRVTRDGGVVVWVVGDATIKGSETLTSAKQAIYFLECGFNVHDTMIWHKKNPLPLQHNRYQPSFEYMYVLSKGKPDVFNKPLVPVKGVAGGAMIKRLADGSHSQFNTQRGLNTHTYMHNVIDFAVGERTKHPAAFPTNLALEHIKSWSNVDAIVFDPFMGSGTTGFAARSISRKFIGCEIVPEYYEIAKNRLSADQS